jgi:predicted nuclease of predicted toxin-antitoxin system
VKFLIDEGLHTTLVDVARDRGHDANYINYLGLSGETDWGLMPRIVAEDHTFVTNNARDFRKLCAKEAIHPGLLIIVPQVLPARQRELFAALLDTIAAEEFLINEVLEISFEGDSAIISRYDLSATDDL